MFENKILEIEWQFIKDAVKILLPFKAASDFLEGDSYQTAAAIIPTLEKLECHLQNHASTMTTAMYSKFQEYWPVDCLEELKKSAF